MNNPKNTLHTLIGMGSSAPAAAVAYPAEMTAISHMGQRITNNVKKKKKKI